ncbi:hypothetical protein [Allokutzneria albata]|uniref:Uncharacterized protein n=1 Tax=Allokutzneria albata TaxID=211114 RepID=A0A1G9WB15_ALLAB|nr:hypothetical protein [Allokutzneria albata]SDM81659.1 hypothetical protein SAMN04489726_3498 [Allokutzneria albata]
MSITTRRAGAAALALCAVTALALPASAEQYRADIAVDVTPRSVLTEKDVSFHSEIIVSNKGTVPITGDWFTVDIPYGVGFVAARGDTWNCGLNPSVSWPQVHCRSEAVNEPGTSRPPVSLHLAATASRVDANVDISVAGFRRGERMSPTTGS